jgi:L-ascorbate metabolism protein UlaG (beta-lactamase superfamily)
MPASGIIDHEGGAGASGTRRYYRATALEGAVLTGDHILTNTGDVTIHPVDHASFVMQWDGKTIYNDPVGGGEAYAGLPPADLILIGHSHGDHYSSSTLGAIAGKSTVIIAPQDVFTRLSSSLKKKTTVLANGESTALLGLTVDAVPAYNANHPQGRDNGYILTVDGKRIYMSGDTGDIAEMRALQNIDVAFIAMNIPYTMSVDQAASAVREFKPGVVYPYHYRNQNGSFADFDRLKELVGKEFPVEIRLRDWY